MIVFFFHLIEVTGFCLMTYGCGWMLSWYFVEVILFCQIWQIVYSKCKIKIRNNYIRRKVVLAKFCCSKKERKHNQHGIYFIEGL